MTMDRSDMLNKIKDGKGFIAALDQSGGSTPKALKNYGVDESAYENEDQMFALVHEMRSRIIKAPAFNGDKILGAILFEKTMDASVDSLPTAQYLWEKLGVVPFLKVDKGLADEQNDVQLMKPMPELDDLLSRAVKAGIFGTKMRSVINKANAKGIADVVAQQFEIGKQILSHGLVPIIEPEVSIGAPDKMACEEMLKAEILKNMNLLSEDRKIMLKLTLPEQANHYADLINHPQIVKVVALSGGYDLNESCERLAKNDGMIASFSRALTNDLRVSQSDEAFNATLESVIDKIYQASITGIKNSQAA